MLKEETLTPLDMRFHFFGWHHDPRNQINASVVTPNALQEYFRTIGAQYGIALTDAQKAWYVKKWETQGDDMFREFPTTPEEAFRAAIEGAYFKTQLSDAYKQKRVITFPVEPGIPVDTAWDLGMNDTTAIWFSQTINREIRFVDFYQHSGEGLAHYRDVLDKKGHKYGNHWAPHDIEVRELGTGKSRREVAQKLGIDFKVAPKLAKEDQIAAARDLFPYCWFHESHCSEGVSALEEYRKEWDVKNGCWKSNPLHNWASNGADAFMIKAVTHNWGSNAAGYTPRRTGRTRRA
jgi:hypothetical protein